MTDLYSETKSELLTKIIKTLEIKASEIGECVELYYDCQDFRIRNANRDRTEPPSDLAVWLDKWMHAGETVISNKLRNWVEGPESPVECKWAYSQIGIGPIIASGLAAHIDPTKCHHVSSIWKFAGLAPGFDRKTKGVKLPYNARLKVLCFKIGESFVKVSSKEDAFYGQWYARFKVEEINRNEAGQYAEAAKRELELKSFRNDNATKKRLLEGKLSDGHLHSRAKRRAVKLFLSGYWVQARKARGLSVSEPYAIAILGHDGKIEPKKQRTP